MSRPRPAADEEGVLMSVLQWDDFDLLDLLHRRWSGQRTGVVVNGGNEVKEGEMKDEDNRPPLQTQYPLA